MTNTERLNEAIAASGLKRGYLAELCDLKTSTSLRNKINNVTEFTASEIGALSTALGLSAEETLTIFFSKG